MLQVPMINLDGLSEAEQQIQSFVQTNLFRLENAVQELDHTVLLYLESEQRILAETVSYHRAANIGALPHLLSRVSMFRSWGLMAGRHGALIIHGFMQTKTFIDKLIVKCEPLKDRVDRSYQKKSNSLFAESFPGISKLRLNVAHPGEFGATPEGFEKDALSGSRVLLDGNMVDGKYGSSITGELTEYELSADTVRKLRTVADLYFKAFPQ